MDIDESKIGKALAAFTASGVSGRPEKEIVISLISFPARMGTIRYSLYSLLTQSLKPDAVILWLTEEEFPDKENSLPDEVLALRENGLSIQWTNNMRAYTKLVPALRAFPQSVIVTADDDIFYPPNWLKRLHADYVKNDRKTLIYAHRAHRIALEANGELRKYETWAHARFNMPGESFLNFGTGVGGILYPPGALHPAACDGTLFREISPYNDDIWFWAMAVLKGTRTRVVEGFISDLKVVEPDEKTPNRKLYLFNGPGGGNNVQMQNVLGKFPGIRNKLLAEATQRRPS